MLLKCVCGSTVCGSTVYARIGKRMHNEGWWNDVWLKGSMKCLLTLYNTDEKTKRMFVNAYMDIKTKVKKKNDDQNRNKKFWKKVRKARN